MENKDNDLYPQMKENIDPGIEKPKEQERKYPSDVPNETARHGFIHGYLI